MFATPGSAVSARPSTRYLLEVHLFDFARSVYGEHVQVEFVRKLRDEKRFDSFDALRLQILEDAASARRVLGLTQADDADLE